MLTSSQLFGALDSNPGRRRASTLPPLGDRQTVRNFKNGWAQVLRPHRAPLQARMNEMSETGFSLFLDFQLPLSASYHLKLHIVHQGKAFAMDVQAQSVYAILVRFDGFRHGFQFAALDAAAEDVIRTVLA